jgi:hypothetical protein
MWAIDYYTDAQSEESDPDPAMHVQADAFNDAMGEMFELLEPMFDGPTLFRYIDEGRFSVVVPIDTRTFELQGTIDVYELKDGK